MSFDRLTTISVLAAVLIVVITGLTAAVSANAFHDSCEDAHIESGYFQLNNETGISGQDTGDAIVVDTRTPVDRYAMIYPENISITVNNEPVETHACGPMLVAYHDADDPEWEAVTDDGDVLVSSD